MDRDGSIIHYFIINFLYVSYVILAHEQNIARKINHHLIYIYQSCTCLLIHTHTHTHTHFPGEYMQIQG